MNSKMTTLLGFLTGIILGGAAAWYYSKEKYAFIAEQEIASVKEAYAKREHQEKPAEPAAPTMLPPGKTRDKPDLVEYAKRLQGEGYTEYSTTVAGKPTEVEAPKGTPGEIPYVISPDEFGEIDEYTQVSLTYFADGVLSDEYGAVVDDVEEIVGDALNHFGEYEEDSVFVRNDAKRCDYEILQDLRTFEEFLKTLPPNH